MADDQILQARKVHAKNIRQSSRWLFYYFMIVVGPSICAAATRAIPYGPLNYIGIPVFLIFFVAPPLIFPGGKHHAKRVALLIIGLLLLSTTCLKWSQKTGQSAKVYPKLLKGYEHGEAPEVYRSV